VSASVRSASVDRGSLDRRCRDAAFGDDARLWKDGGGEFGMGNDRCVLKGDVSSSSTSCICKARRIVSNGKGAFGDVTEVDGDVTGGLRTRLYRCDGAIMCYKDWKGVRGRREEVVEG
jgi:hypothetical protein